MAKYQIHYIDERFERDEMPLELYISSLVSFGEQSDKCVRYVMLSTSHIQPTHRMEYVHILDVGGHKIPDEMKIYNERAQPPHAKDIVGFIARPEMGQEDFELVRV